jgi:Bacterial membrane protein YfhO
MVPSSNRTSIVDSRPTTKEVASFCALAVALLAFLFRDALLHGYVLGQADFLFGYLPWKAYKPLGWRIHNQLLGDIPALFYPFLFHAKEAILHGQFPLWASAIGGGHPFFAAFQTAVLSPFTLFDYLLPFPAGFTADVAARLFAGGLGMYLYLRGLPIGHGPAVFGGVAYLLNPFSIVWLEHPLSAVAACLPWLLWGIDRCVYRDDRRSVAVLAGITAVTLLTGHPETAFKELLLASAYAIYRSVKSGRAIRSTALLSAAMALGALAASVQILPFLEYARESRGLVLRGQIGLLASPLSAFVTAFVPDFYGSPLRNRFVLSGTNYCEQQLYPGIVTWVFAALGLTHRRHRQHVVFFLSAGTIAVLIMYGTPVARLAALLIPPLRVAAVSRFGLIAIAGVIVTSAVGVDAIFGQNAASALRPRRALVVATAAGVLIAVIVAAFLWTQQTLLVEGHQWAAAVAAVTNGTALLIAAIAVIAIASRLQHKAAIALPIGLLTIDLLAFGDRFHALMPRELVFPQVSELTVPRADRGLFRVAGWADALMPNTALVYGLQDFRGYDGVGLRDYSALLDIGFHFNGSTHRLVNAATPHLLDLLNVKYVLTPTDVELPRERFLLLTDGATRVWRNERVQSRAFLVDTYVVLQGDAARRAIRDRLDLTRVAVLDRTLDRDREPETSSGDVGTAEVERYSDYVVSVRTRTSGRRLLVLSDVYYPGWVATIDGTPAQIHRADYALRAVTVPAGDHTIEFHYRPASVRYGAWISALSLGVVASLIVSSTRARSVRDAHAIPSTDDSQRDQT